ncbi:hypothetical protein HPB49_004541 [Dermacentor silvarum]|uniref:Uncharacterized protein n=1 Tax=Dermacentor silvarum TaxID=543639 RepID=A0ACB8CPW1_DERSI|nr:hypothetical protein HPB49_004541 [Dermacentor silvarum]
MSTSAKVDFRKARRSMDNVISLVNCVKLIKAARNITIDVFLDIKGAFDNVTDESVGVGGHMCHWISDYLTDRSVNIYTKEGDTAAHTVHRGP